MSLKTFTGLKKCSAGPTVCSSVGRGDRFCFFGVAWYSAYLFHFGLYELILLINNSLILIRVMRCLVPHGSRGYAFT